ncbi:SulP family inorganic anion transporter [uncultured Boseongicola sp.]|jgi:SulP family sulfate permease|uniref:SulP family inorganic anion transporter n=1 Tax=uncultured Boseongicola sp. TaxID=1648499 RepID=UPI002629E865|nr:SulP family inorganic anion transporter [uncultured Boseongicola sp.]
MAALARRSIFSDLPGYVRKADTGHLPTELLAGLTVALALVPEAVAFAFVAGVHPLVGLYAAFIVGLITAVFGGRPGMISGATGALAVVMVSLVATHGVEYLFATVVLMGAIQIAVGVLKWGKFIRLVPHPVMLGFVNGLAIVIFLAQLTQFQVPGTAEASGHGIGGGEWMTGWPLSLMLMLVVATMGIIWVMPKITNAIPAPLAGIGIVALVVIVFGFDVPRVGDLASIKGGLPQFHVPVVPLTFETFEIILPYALILSAIGLIESLLTLNLVGEITGKRGGASRECIAQGAANTITGFFGGMGGCAMIGQSMINVKSGGRTRVSGISAALFLLMFIVVAAPLIEQIPLAALVGVMFMVVIGTFAWNSFNIMRRVPLSDSAVIVLVTLVTVMYDLATAVVVGVIVSALTYAWNNATRIHAKRYDTPEGARVYQIQGPLFFGSSEGFAELFEPKDDPAVVIVDFADSRVVDQSALTAIEAVAEKYEAAGKSLQLRHLSHDCHQLLSKAGQLIVDSDDDPDYEIATDYSIRTGILAGGH